MSRSELETRELVNLFEVCYSEAGKAFIEQTQIESPFPGQKGAILDNPWPIYDEFYRGQQWKRMGRMPGWKSTPVNNNYCFTVPQSYTTFITDNRGKAQFIPTEESDAELANKTQAVWNWWCSLDAYDAKASLAVLDSRKWGIGWRHLRRDKDAPLGQTIEVVNPDAIKVDPDATAADFLGGKGPTYLIYEYISQLSDLKAAYKVDFDWDTEFDAGWHPGDSISTWDRVMRVVGVNRESKNPAKSVPVYELWLRDGSLEFDETEVGDKVAVTQRKKFPRGRRVVYAGNQILLDEENPYKHGEFPFVPVFAYPSSDRFYCAGDIENIISQQVMLNRTAQLLYDSMVKSGGGIALVNKRFGLSADMMTNDPMQVHEVLDVNNALRFQQFPSTPRHVYDFYGVLQHAVDDAAGIHDISKGVYTPGNKTAQEISALTESDKTRVRLAARVLAISNEILARQWLHNAAQWNDWQVFVRVSGDDGETNVSMVGTELRKIDEKGKGYSDDVIDFDITIADSSTLPTYFQERKQMAMDLFNMQVIDAEALLEVLDFPGWRAITARMKANVPEQMPQDASMPPQDASMQGAMPPPEAMQPPQMPVGVPQEPIQTLSPQDGTMTPQMGMMPPDASQQQDEFMQIVMQIATQTGMAPEEVLAMAQSGQVPA